MSTQADPEGSQNIGFGPPPPENSINPRTLVWGKLTVDQCHIFSTIFTEVKYYNLLFLLMYLDDLNKK